MLTYANNIVKVEKKKDLTSWLICGSKHILESNSTPRFQTISEDLQESINMSKIMTCRYTGMQVVEPENFPPGFANAN